MTKQNFLKCAVVLGVAGIIVKILGAFYRIPLANMISDQGMGYYQPSYYLYAFLIAVSTVGFPTAIAKLVSEKRAQGNYRGASRVFKISLIGLTIVGIVTSIAIFSGAKVIADFIGISGSYYSLIALAPALLFVPIMSSFRGYFQGRQTMLPTALSQIVESLFRVIFGLTLAYYLLGLGLPEAAGGASFGASAGAIAGTIIMVVMYLKSRKNIKSEIENGADCEQEETFTLIKRILSIAIPITIGASIVPLMNNIDVMIVSKRLQEIGYTEKEATALFGQLSGMAQTLINLPQVFSRALAISLVPAVSDAFARRDFDNIKRVSRSGVRITLLIGLPAALGLFILARPIIGLLYFKNTASVITSTGSILQFLSFSVIFLTLLQSLTAVLQGLDKAMIPVRNMAIGAGVKLVLTYILTGIRIINVKGAAIGTVSAYLVATVLNFIEVKKRTNTKFKLVDVFIKPVISVIIMAIFTWLSYNNTFSLIGSKSATVLSIIVGGVTYGIALLITGAITYRDFTLLPKGDKIGNTLKKMGLLRK